MTVKELWTQYQFYTGNLTEHTRKLGFAGVAVCWMFKDANYSFPALIYLALFGFVSFFLFDTLQYFVAAAAIRFFTEKQEAILTENKKSLDTPIEKPRWVDRPAFFLWIGKYIVLTAAFILVGVELLWKFAKAHF
jgi:hypothetical protein